MMTSREMTTARETLIDCHRSSSTPAETVKAAVAALGYEAAREIVALCVVSKGEWDQRISETARRWAFDLTGTTYGTLSARYFYYPDSIHPAHMDQIAAAMMAYQPEPEQPEAVTVTNPETGDTITREFTAAQLHEAARDGYTVTRTPAALYKQLHRAAEARERDAIAHQIQLADQIPTLHAEALQKALEKMSAATRARLEALTTTTHAGEAETSPAPTQKEEDTTP